MDDERQIPKCPLIDIQTDEPEVPQHIKRTFAAIDSEAHVKSGEQRQSEIKNQKSTIDEADEQGRPNTTSSESQSLPPPNLEKCIQHVLDEDYRMDLMAEFSNEYVFNEKPRKLSLELFCPFCLKRTNRLYSAISEQTLQSQAQSVTFLRSKILNESFCSHQRCFEEFGEGRSKCKLVLLGDLAPAEYVLGDDDQDADMISQRPGPVKEAFVEIGFYHPISNKLIFEVIRKLSIHEGEQQSGVGRFRFAEGFLGAPDYISLPYDCYRVCFKITILDADELHNRHTIMTVVACKKVKVLPVKQCFTLKITGKKMSLRVGARTTSSNNQDRKPPSECLIALVDAEVNIQGIFAEKKKKEVFMPATHTNYSTYSETGIRNKRKKEVSYVDLSPEVRSVNKSMNNYPQQAEPRQQPQISDSGISFREYNHAQEKSRSDNSRLSYISKELNMEEVQQAIQSDTLHTYLRTQSGSRSLQKYINSCGEQDIDVILRALDPHFSSLFCDSYANFFCKTLCEVCTPKQRVLIATKLHRNIDQISRDKRGTHSVQTLVSMVSTPSEEAAVYQMLERYFIGLSRDEQGCHIIKKMLLRLSDARIASFLGKVCDSLLELATNQNGIIVVVVSEMQVKELITRMKPMADKRSQILNFLENHFDELIQNGFGNYAIQHVIEGYPLKECDKLLNRILSRVAAYSNQKISSNVVEKCIMNTNEDIKNKFIVVLARDEVIVELMRNKFGNFVLEKALKASSKTEHKLLMKAMSKNLESVTSSGLKQKWQDYLYDYEC